MSCFGHRLRELRVAAGLTQAELAEHIGVSNTYVSALESGRKPAPPHAVVTSLALSLRIDERELWQLAAQEREERLRLRINGVPTSLRTHKASGRPSPAPTEPDELDRMEALIRTVRETCQSPEGRRKTAAILEMIAQVLREE